MKKFGNNLIAFVFAIILSVAACLMPAPRLSSYAADPTNPPASEETEGDEEPAFTVPEMLFENIAITQSGDGYESGYAFQPEDFVVSSAIAGVPATLYTNKTVTIYLLAEIDTEIGDSFTIIVNGDNPIISDNVVKEDDPHVVTRNSKQYFVFNVDALETDTATRIFIRLTLNNVTEEFTFALVQTKLKLKTTGVYWQFNYGSVDQTITEPTPNYTYAPLTLYLPTTSDLNPITIKFVYCGETFELYKKGDKFYEPTYSDDGFDKELEFENLIFDVSGTYTVEIFDKTNNENYPSNNYMFYSFKIENNDQPLNRFYFNAHLESGEIIMNKQITNDKTILELVNIDTGTIRNLIDRIVIERTYKPTGAQNITVPTTLGRSDVAKLIDEQNSELVFDEDGHYVISVYLATSEIKQFEFTLFKNIGTQFEIDGKYYTIDSDTPENETKTIHISRSVETRYASSKTPLTSKSEYSFYIVVARSNPRIDGVKDRARVSGDLVVAVSGVGKLSVSITQDGKTTTREFTDSDENVGNRHTLQTFTTPGHYIITVTDEMGTVVTKSFTISVKMNTAAIILLAIAGAVVLLVIVLIIFSRMRVKVR